MRCLLVTVTLVALCGGCDRANPPPPLPRLPPNAPKDQPVRSKGKEAVEEYEAAIAPYVEQGRKTYPEAKKRYLEGLPPGHVFYLVTRLRDGAGTTEDVFVAVSSIRDGRITGRIATDVKLGARYKPGDVYSFPEGEVLDWMVSRPDGTEEGNVVGKFLDEWQKDRRGK